MQNGGKKWLGGQKDHTDARSKLKVWVSEQAKVDPKTIPESANVQLVEWEQCKNGAADVILLPEDLVVAYVRI